MDGLIILALLGVLVAVVVNRSRRKMGLAPASFIGIMVVVAVIVLVLYAASQ